MNRQKIKAEAKEIIKGNLWNIFKPYLIIILFTFTISYTFNPANQNDNLNMTINFITSLLIYPINIGIIAYILNLIRKKESDETLVFKYYRKFIYVAGLYILVNLFVTLWSILFIIPGIIAALSYAMAPYLLADDEGTPLECIKRSQKMMQGYKWDYFKFLFSFFGWFLITIFAFWYVIPYTLVSQSLYYEELKKQPKID